MICQLPSSATGQEQGNQPWESEVRTITNVRNIFFDKVSKEEALNIWKADTDKRELYLLHDDYSESLIEDVSEIEEAWEPIGVALSEHTRNNRKYEAYTQLYKKLDEARAHLINSPIVEGILTDVMDAINYIQALGF